MTVTIGRRELLAALGGAAIAWPLAAGAQQGERMRRVGVFMNLAKDDPESKSRLAALVEGLQQLGWSEGRNLRIDTRWGSGDADSFRRQAAELVTLAPDVTIASGATLVALQHVTRTIPIVFVNVTDPVGGGFVESLAQPGGNTTGFTPFEIGFSAKWL
jgi:putative ABC transport system substrate-binding protein